MNNKNNTIRVAELFAGVGGFRVGLDNANADLHKDVFDTVFADQWEPDGKPSKQFAWRCYEAHFGKGSCINEDIEKVLDDATSDNRALPSIDMICGSTPCQSFSVARPRTRSVGLDDVPGGKGLLWWQFDRMVRMTNPSFVLLENVDRMTKTPTGNRGRDFATILSCLLDGGYDVEWRVINAADYGCPQKRRRVFVLGVRHDLNDDTSCENLSTNGVMSNAFPCTPTNGKSYLTIPSDPQEAFKMEWMIGKKSPFKQAGCMTSNGDVVTYDYIPVYDGKHMTLADVLVSDEDVPESYYVRDEDYPKWECVRASKRIPRVDKDGHEYFYSEGSMACPDPIDKPARTILTGSGGSSASRMKHIIATGRSDADHRYRRLVPDELDAIQCFPKGWTDVAGLTDTQRAFCMGNSLVTEIPRRIGGAIAEKYGYVNVDSGDE